ncbi:MAG: beta-lactamase family protein [Anaerolineales bacterium]|nr:beta-lactamase family protein [Anaerolineales bacterium]
MQIITTGFKISGLEEEDLTGIAPLTVTPAITEPLEAFIEDYMEKFDIPGAAVGIVQNGSVVYARGFGVANPETGAPMTPETNLMIGSTGKSLTTLMMGTLVDDGLMTWDTPVVELFPAFKVKDPELSKTITMRNLVCACTGVPRRDFEFLFNAQEQKAEDIVASLGDFEFFTKFGEAFQYSNQMVGTAGYVAAPSLKGTDDLLANYKKALAGACPIRLGWPERPLTLTRWKHGVTMPHRTR